MQSNMSEVPTELLISFLRVHDDIAEQTFTVNLEDVVGMIDDPDEPGKFRSLIIDLLNSEILDRHPHVGGTQYNPLDITISEFSDLKMEVIRRVRALTQANGGPAAQRG